jgi:hypothetical protein
MEDECKPEELPIPAPTEPLIEKKMKAKPKPKKKGKGSNKFIDELKDLEKDHEKEKASV